MGEPDHLDSWLGSGTGGRARRLREHIALFAATYRAVKSVDPRAKVGGPATMNWQETKYTVDPECTLEEWIRELASFNVSADVPVVPDYIAWQDYAWSSDRLSDGADAVAAFLRRYGFDPATPKMLSDSGWGSWCSDYIDQTLEPHVRASHAACNIVHEFKDPRDRKFWQALYFHFYWNDEAFGTDDPDGQLHRSVALGVLSRDGRFQLTPIYAAFEMASAMAHGEIIASSAPEPLEAMAVRDDDVQRIIVTVNNHTEESRNASVTLRDVPFGRDAVMATVQLIDGTHSGAGGGLERGTSQRVAKIAGEIVVPVSLGAYATAQITVQAA